MTLRWITENTTSIWFNQLACTGRCTRVAVGQLSRDRQAVRWIGARGRPRDTGSQVVHVPVASEDEVGPGRRRPGTALASGEAPYMRSAARRRHSETTGSAVRRPATMSAGPPWP